MRRSSTVCIGLLTLALAVGSAQAHLGEMKYMFQFPAGLEPELDGDMSDWDIVGDFYRARAENMFNQFGAPMDLADFNMWQAWGYSLATNKAYFAYWVADDMLNNTEKWSTTTDWDHTGGQFRSFGQGTEYDLRWDSAQAQRYDIAAPVYSASGYYTKCLGKDWAGQPPYIEWGGRILQGDVGTFEPAEMFGEVAIVPFDDIHPDGESASIKHTFREGDIVGIETNWGDKDADPGAYDDAYWSIFGGVGAYQDANMFGDYLLSPVESGSATAVQDNTWGQIKSSFITE
ncbi:MAG: hypothetical protein AB1505_00550 [Candidatus Latescibacterota bacterium]